MLRPRLAPSRTRTNRIPAGHLSRRARLALEQLEDRALPAVSLDYSTLAAPLTVTESTASFTQVVTAPDRPSSQTQTFTATVKPSGLPNGVTVSTSPAVLSFGPVYPSTPSWIVTFQVAANVPNGTYTNIKIKATPDSQSVSEGAGTQVTLIVARPVSLNLSGTNGNDTIIINSTSVSINGTVTSLAGITNLTIDALGGNDTFTVNNSILPGSLALIGGAGADSASLNGANNGALSVTAETVTIGSAVQTGAGGLNISASSIAASAAITTTGGGPVTLTATGALSFTSAADINADGAVALSGSTITTAGDITTTNDAVTFASPTVLSGPVAINAGTGAVSLQSTLNGGHGLTVSAGNLTFSGAVGGITRLGAITVPSANNVTVAAGLRSASLTQNAGAGTTTLNGVIDTNGAGGVALSSNVIAINGSVNVAGGNVALTAANSISQNAGSSITVAGSGTATLTATSGSITMAANAQTASGSGAISYQAGAGIVLGVLSTTGNVSLNAGSGAITDANGAANNVTALGLTMTAGAGIGSAADPIETVVSTLSASGGSGGVHVANTGNLAITSAAAGSGDVVITSTGALNLGAGASITTGAGSVTLTAETIDIAVGALVQSAGGVTMDAEVDLMSGGQIQAQGEVSLTGGALDADLEDSSFTEATFHSTPAAGRTSRLKLNRASLGQATFTGNAFDIDASGAVFGSALFDTDALGFDLDAFGFDPDAAGFDLHLAAASFDSVVFKGNAFDIDANGATFDVALFDVDGVGFDPDAAGFDFDALGFDIDAIGATFGQVLFKGSAFDIDATGATFTFAQFDTDALGFGANAAGFDIDAFGFDPDALGFELKLTNASFGAALFKGNAFDIDATGATFDVAQFDTDALGFDPDALGFAAGALGFALDATNFDPDAEGFDIDALGFALGALGFDLDALGFDVDALGFDIDATGATFGQVLFRGNAFDIDAVGATFDSVLFDTDATGFDPDALGFDPDAEGFDPDALGFAMDALGFDIDASGAVFNQVFFKGNAFDIDATGATFSVGLFQTEAEAFDPDALGFDPDAEGFDLDALGFDVDATGAVFDAAQFKGQYFDVILTGSYFSLADLEGSHFDVNMSATTFDQVQAAGDLFNVNLSDADFGQGFFLASHSTFTAFSATFDAWFNQVPGTATTIDVSGSTFNALTNQAADVTLIKADGAHFGQLVNLGNRVSNISALGADFGVIANHGDDVAGIIVSGTATANTVLNLGDRVTGINFSGGGGRDLFVNTGSDVTATINGDGGDDLVHLAGAGVSATLDGGTGSDTVIFAGALTGSVILQDAPEAGGDLGRDTLDFSSFSAAVVIDLANTAAQTVSPGLALTFANSQGIENVVGSAFADVIRGNGRDNFLQGADLLDDRVGAPSSWNGRVQVVFLDFDSQTGSGDRSYSTEERAAVRSGMEALYRGPDAANPWFPVEFYLSASEAQARAEATGSTVYATIFFNKPRVNEDGTEEPGGVSEEVDFRNLSLGGTAAVQVLGLLGGPGQAADTSANWVAASVYIGAHELAHMLGVRHADSYGPIGYGIHNPPGAGAYAPSYPGLAGAFETSSHLISSTGSTGAPLSDIANDHFFGEREAIRLAYAFYAPLTPQAGTLFVAETASPHADNATAQALDLQALQVPNTIEVGLNAGKQFAVAAVNVRGAMTSDSEADVYSFTGRKGDLINLEVVSDGVIRPASATDPSTRNSDNRPINSVIEVFDQSGNLVAYFGGQSSNDNQFEAFDSSLIDLTLPADGNYFVRVTTKAAEDGLGAFTPANPGLYELFVYRFDAGNAADQGDILEGRGGNDLLEGGLGGDRYVFSGSNLGSDVIREDLRFVASQVGVRDAGDTLDFTNLAGAATVDLARSDAQVVNAGNLTVWLTSMYSPAPEPAGQGIEAVLGSGFNDFLFGNQRDNVLWGGTGGNDRLEGRDGNDTFVFDATATGSDTVVGGAGSDTMDFSGQTDLPTHNFDTRTGGVNLDLDKGSSQSVGGGLSVALPEKDIENAFGSLVGANTLTGNALDNILVGGAGADEFVGAAGNDILIGGDGDDTLTGGDGRDILIGGFGADRITGSAQDDILVGGRSAFDYAAGLTYLGADGNTHQYQGDATYLALRSILAEWTSGRDYLTRVANINNTVGQSADRLNGGYYLREGLDTTAGGTVNSADGAIDRLTGSGDLDVFFLIAADDITDANNQDEVTGT